MATLITSVTPADRLGTPTGAAVTSILEPAKFQWTKTDVKSSMAGKMASQLNLKMLVGKTRTLYVEWRYKTFAEVATLLAAFDHEYVNITYIDGLTGAAKTSHMTVDEMTAGCYYASGGGKWETISITCAQATPDGV